MSTDTKALREAAAACASAIEADPLDAIILATRTKAFTEGHAAGMQAAYDGEVTNAALAKARAEGRREGVEAADALARAADVAAVAWGHERVCSTCAEESPPDCLRHPNAGTSDPAITLDGALAAYRAIRDLLPSAGPVAARYQAEWDAMRANADAPESFADTPPADWRPPWQEHKDIRPPLRSVGDSATGPVAARWAARPVEERKALLADALSGEGITQGCRRGRTMASDLLAAAKAVLARYDHDQSPYVADDALAKRMREVVMADLRAAVEEAERASPPKRETPAEHFRACGPFCAHVQHCPKCANVHGFCGGHATPDDAIRWADPKGGES